MARWDYMYGKFSIYDPDSDITLQIDLSDDIAVFSIGVVEDIPPFGREERFTSFYAWERELEALRDILIEKLGLPEEE